MDNNNKDILKLILWINLFIGIYNIYLYVNGDWLFNIIIGSLNIGAWVFNRNIIFNNTEK